MSKKPSINPLYPGENLDYYHNDLSDAKLNQATSLAGVAIGFIIGSSIIGTSPYTGYNDPFVSYMNENPAFWLGFSGAIISSGAIRYIGSLHRGLTASKNIASISDNE